MQVFVIRSRDLIGCCMVAASLLACGTDPPKPEPIAEVGTGVDTWEPILESIYLVEGAQGGRHVIGNVRVEGMAPGTTRDDSPATRFDLFKADGSRVSPDIPPFSMPFIESLDGGFTLPFGRYVFVELAAVEVLDTMVELRVEVTQNGQTVQDSRWALVVPYVP